MLNLLVVSVIDKERLEELIQEGKCTSISDLDPSVPQGYDYAETALIDSDKNHIIYWNDNIHEHPSDFINAFTTALKYTNIKYLTKKLCMLNNTLKKFSGEKY